MKHNATRIDVGGKLLTNLMIETLSFKEINMQGETQIVNQIKEESCFVSQDFENDLEIVNNNPIVNPYRKEFVLPDYKNIAKGYFREVIV